MGQENFLLAIGIAFILVCLPSFSQDIPFTIGLWEEDGKGNHRAIVEVKEKADAVWVHIPWRRRDPNPQDKAILIYDSSTQKRILNVVRVNINQEFGDIIFQPSTVPGKYEIYYLPYNCPKGPMDVPQGYLPPEDTADRNWLERNHLKKEDLQAGSWRNLPQAKVLEIQARDEFNSFYPMEVIATREEIDSLLSRYPFKEYLVFPEDRLFPVKMFETIPQKWAIEGPKEVFHGEAQPGEYYVFQLGIWAVRADINDLKLKFPRLKGENGEIPPSSFDCINLGGIDWLGRPFKKTFNIAKGRVRPLWIGITVPPQARGKYEGDLIVEPKGLEATKVKLILEVKGELLKDYGDSELWRLSRLRWLNSTLGLSDDPIPPFTPLKIEGKKISLLGRSVVFDEIGLPKSIQSWGREILLSPIKFVVETEKGTAYWKGIKERTVKKAKGVLEKEITARDAPLVLRVIYKVEFDGCIRYDVFLKGEKDVHLKDVRLEIPLRKEIAKYMMGMSYRGGYRPREWSWKWDINRADNMVWLGDVPAGLQIKLEGERDFWAMVDLRDVGIPKSWDNEGKGGCDIEEKGDAVLVKAHSGERVLKANEELRFGFRFLITPFKEIDRNHWNWRIGGWLLDETAETEANIFHLHHATYQNPYINYPFLTVDDLKKFVEEVKSVRYKLVELGKIIYPAEGNIDLTKGALHLWVRVNFDPKKGKAGDARFNQELFHLDFPNQDQLGFYWNIDDRGMRAYVRKGAPQLNQYPVLIGTNSPEWEKGQRHILTLSWGEEFAIYVDGKKLKGAPYKGILSNELRNARMVLEGKPGEGFAVEAIKIEDEPYNEGKELKAAIDEHTLFLDTFSKWFGGRETKPEKGNGVGIIEGVCEIGKGVIGKEVIFSAKKVQTPPKGINIYYTVRELSNHCQELWALRSLGDEVFVTGGVDIYGREEIDQRRADGGYPWLKEHLVWGYVPAWMTPTGRGDIDAAIATQGLSRWHNYYVEGMRYLMEKTGVDGLYLDGIGYDREIMKRIRRVMKSINPQSRINFHSGNEYDYMEWHLSPANKYMEHFPYIDSLWFGEMYDYDRSPDYWLVEISGIPFGLTGEMLNYENGGNPYRGMLYGMTGRFHPSAPYMWRFWDEFGIQEAEMIGYWAPECPVKTGRDDVLATVYKKKGEALIAIASWAKENVKVRLNINWTFLGLNPDKAKLIAPEIEYFQGAGQFLPVDEIPVEAGKGWLFILKEQ
ncbi:MAG: glycoside hydrolase domain-containing protein [bacterium]